MKISVVTPVLNGERHIRQTVDSILAQKGDFELEYVVKDGQSSDRTLEILKEYGDLLKVVSCPDTSTEEAIVQGFEHCSGDIFCWLGADDLYLEGTFQAAIDAFAAHPNRDWQYGRCLIIDDSGRKMRQWITWYKNVVGYFYSRRLLLCENYINQPAVFFKPSLWEKACGSFTNYHFASDYNLWVNFSKYSKAIAIHRYYSSFRRHRTSNSNENYLRQLDESIEISRKHGNSLYAFIYRLNKWKTVFVYRLLGKEE